MNSKRAGWLMGIVGLAILAFGMAGVSRAQLADWQKSDSNRDGVVDHNDLYALHRAWLMSGTPADDSWNLSGDDIYRLEGNIGIGTSNPSADLDVVGTIRARLASGGSAARMNADEFGGLFEVVNSYGNAASRLWVDEGGGGLLTLNDPAGYRLTSVGSDADGGLLVLENNLGAAVANVWVNSSSVGLITLNDSQGQPRLDLFSDEIGGIVDLSNFNQVSAGRFWVSDEGAGLLTLNDPQENLRVVLTVLSTGAGDLRLDGPNGKANVSLASVNSNANRGVVSVHDTDGNPRAQMYVDSNGNGFVGPVTSKGTVAAGVGVDASGRGMLWAEQSYSVEDHPSQPGSKIVYSNLEGPEAAIYCRGKVQLVEGRAEIELPEDFIALAKPGSLTVQLTPGSLDSKGLAFESLGKRNIRIGELAGGTGSYEVHYTVYALRAGYEDQKTVMTEEEFRRTFQPDRPAAATASSARPAAGTDKAAARLR